MEHPWKFAFAIPPVAQADDALFQAKVLRPLLGEGDDPREASVRRLHFEAHTVAVADVRRWPIVAPVQRIVRGEGRADRSQAHLGDQQESNGTHMCQCGMPNEGKVGPNGDYDVIHLLRLCFRPRLTMCGRPPSTMCAEAGNEGPQLLGSVPMGTGPVVR